MERQNNTKSNYQLSQSTIVQSPYIANKHLPNLSSNSNDVGAYKKQINYGGNTGDNQFSNFTGWGKQDVKHGQISSNNKSFGQNYANQYPQPNYGIEGNSLSRSTIIDQNYNGDTSIKKYENNNNQQKYGNINGTRTESNNTQQSIDTLSKNQGLSNELSQKKQSQNVSLQFSPRKLKKVDGPNYKQFNGEHQPVIQKNNLDNYKKIQLDNTQRNNQQQTNYMKFSAHNIPTSNSSKIDSPSNSLDHQKSFMKRQFSSGRLNTLLKGNQRVSPSSSDTNYFSSQLKHKQSIKQNFKKDDFAIIKKLGKGKYGDVFLTQHKYSRIICALKVISKEVIMKQDDGCKQFIRQVIIHTFVSNPYIIEMWGIFSDSQNMYLIQEPALDGQLFKYMRQKKYLEESQAAGFIKQLCIGVEYLQSEKVIHRDLKPENILLHAGKIKICDFGWAVYNQDSFRQTFCGTPLYLSPDVLVGSQYNDKVDNWAIGIITYEMLFGKIPFKITTQSQMQKILNQQIQFPEHIEVSGSAKDFILSLLDRNPDTRMDIEQVLSHPFLSNVN